MLMIDHDDDDDDDDDDDANDNIHPPNIPKGVGR